MLQIKRYADMLMDMGLNVEKRILVYVGDFIEVVEL